MHSRRARPTIRLLKEDLTSDWVSPWARRVLREGRYIDLHPLSELPHPIIAKAAESFAADADADNYIGPIASSTHIRQMEIKTGRWRGGVWLDQETGVNWLIVAGLAKGNHEDRDDFYQRVQRENDEGDPRVWLPTADDVRLLKQETAARVLTEWELALQRRLWQSLGTISDGGNARVDVNHPIRASELLASIDISVAMAREEGYEADEINVDIVSAPAHRGSELIWQATIRTLITLSPPEQDWDRYKDTFSNIAEPGYFSQRVDALESVVARGVLAESEPEHYSHYAHRRHLAGCTIDGKAVRALCGAYFVPTQDHDGMACCPTCQQRLDSLPT